MTKISKRGGIGILDDTKEETKISWCPRCIKNGFYEALGSRIYKEGEPYRKGDEEKWRQCRVCGTLVAIWETKLESTIKDSVEPTSDKFGLGKNILGLENKKPKSKIAKERKRLIDRANKEVDSEIRTAILKGQIIEDISDY